MLSRFFEYRFLFSKFILTLVLTFGQLSHPCLLQALSYTYDDDSETSTTAKVAAITLGIAAGAVAGGYIGQQNRKHHSHSNEVGPKGPSGASFAFPEVDSTLDVSFSSVLDSGCTAIPPVIPLKLTATIVQPDQTIINVGILNEGSTLTINLGPPIQVGNYKIVLTYLEGTTQDDITIVVNGVSYFALMGYCNGAGDPLQPSQYQFIVDFTIPS